MIACFNHSPFLKQPQQGRGICALLLDCLDEVSEGDRLDTALLQPVADEATEAEFTRLQSEWDPESGAPAPLPKYDYDYFLPEADAVRGIKRKFDTTDPENDDDELYTEENTAGQRMFKYARVRRYETHNQHGDPENIWNDSIALALHDPDMEVSAAPGAKKRLAKGAYLYPVSQRTGLHPLSSSSLIVLRGKRGHYKLEVYMPMP